MLKEKLKKISFDRYFLALVIILYIYFWFTNPGIFQESLKFAFSISLKVIPVFILVFVLMVLVNYFVSRDYLVKQLGRRGYRKWVFAVVAGIISSGPIYIWYPLLGELKEKGASYGLIACFLYNRSLKIPLIPIFLLYFSLEFIITLGLVMIVASLVQAQIIEKII